MKRFLVLGTVLTLTLLGSTIASAGPLLVWDFNPSAVSGAVGAASYTVDSVPSSGILLTVYGYNINGTPRELYWKQEGADEHGIGLVGTTDNELTLQQDGSYANYMVIDLFNLLNTPGAQNPQIRVQSVTQTERWDLYGWDGSSFTALEIGNTDNNVFRALPAWGTYRGYAVAVTEDSGNTGNNVLFDAIAAELVTVPDAGSTLLLLGMGLVGLRGWRRRLG